AGVHVSGRADREERPRSCRRRRYGACDGVRRARGRGRCTRLRRGGRRIRRRARHLVHSVAFAAAEDLEGRFTDTPRDRFWMAVDVSAYSLVACARAAEPLMEKAGGGSIVTMTYLGG